MNEAIEKLTEVLAGLRELVSRDGEAEDVDLAQAARDIDSALVKHAEALDVVRLRMAELGF